MSAFGVTGTNTVGASDGSRRKNGDQIRISEEDETDVRVVHEFALKCVKRGELVSKRLPNAMTRGVTFADMHVEESSHETSRKTSSSVM